MRRVACALCGKDNGDFLFVGRDRLHGLSGEFDLVCCRACSLVYLDPRPSWDEARKFYPPEYAPHRVKAASWLERLIRGGGLRKKRDIVLRHKQGGSLLDVGCATGDFLSLMSEDGRWNVWGVEADPQAAGCATRVAGAEVVCGRAEDVDYPPSSFDVVTMWHVLEHLHDPKRALRRVRRALRHDGVLIVAVPVLDSVDARLFGRYWSGYDVPRHLSTFSMATLSSMLVAAGFSSINFESFIGGYDAFGISVGFWADERIRARRVRSLIRIASRSVVLRVFMVPYFAVVNFLGRGSTVVATGSPADLAGRPVETKSGRAFPD